MSSTTVRESRYTKPLRCHCSHGDPIGPLAKFPLPSSFVSAFGSGVRLGLPPLPAGLLFLARAPKGCLVWTACLTG